MADEVALAAGATLLARGSGADHLFNFDYRFLRCIWAPVFAELHRICVRSMPTKQNAICGGGRKHKVCVFYIAPEL